MKRVPVKSSNVASVGYDEPSRKLEVEFNDGSVYQYFGVPSLVYQGLISTAKGGGSVGRFFDQNVKKAGYEYAQL